LSNLNDRDVITFFIDNFHPKGVYLAEKTVKMHKNNAKASK